MHTAELRTPTTTCFLMWSCQRLNGLPLLYFGPLVLPYNLIFSRTQRCFIPAVIPHTQNMQWTSVKWDMAEQAGLTRRVTMPAEIAPPEQYRHRLCQNSSKSETWSQWKVSSQTHTENSFPALGKNLATVPDSWREQLDVFESHWPLCHQEIAKDKWLTYFGPGLIKQHRVIPTRHFRIPVCK